MITKVVSPKTFQTDDVIALVNALAIVGKWQSAFSKLATRDDHLFSLANGTTQVCTMMLQNNSRHKVAENSHIIAVNMPYRCAPGQPAASLLAIMPQDPSATIESLLAHIRAAGLPTLFTSERLARLGFPKFSFTQKRDMIGSLSALGLPISEEYFGFDPTTAYPVVFRSVIQACRIECDEEGVKAAAVTMMNAFFATTGRPRTPPRTIIFDRPFAYFLLLADMPLFAGIFRDPRHAD